MVILFVILRWGCTRKQLINRNEAQAKSCMFLDSFGLVSFLKKEANLFAVVYDYIFFCVSMFAK